MLTKFKSIFVLSILAFLTLSAVFFACLWRVQSKIIYKDRLIIATVFPLGPFTPFSLSGVSAMLRDIVYPPLFDIHKDGSIKYGLIEKYQLNEDGSEVTFFLKEGVRGEDVVHSLKTAKDKNLPLHYKILENVVDISLPAPNQVLVKLKSYDRFFLEGLIAISIFSGQGDFKSTGGFDLVGQASDKLVLKRKQPDAQKVNFIEVRHMDNDLSIMRALLKGEVDIVLGFSKPEPYFMKDIPGIKFELLNNEVLSLLLENPRSSNPINWKEFNKKVDREKLMSRVSMEFSSPASFPVSKKSVWYDGVALSNLDLGDSGQPTAKINKKILVFEEMPSYISLAAYLKAFLGSEGVELTLQTMNLKEFDAGFMETQDYDLFLIPANFRASFFSNYSYFRSAKRTLVPNYQNPEVDRYLDQARYTQDFPEAKKAFTQAMLALNEDPPGLFLFWNNDPIAYNQNCEGLDFSVTENFMHSLGEVSCQMDRSQVFEKTVSALWDWE